MKELTERDRKHIASEIVIATDIMDGKMLQYESVKEKEKHAAYHLGMICGILGSDDIVDAGVSKVLVNDYNRVMKWLGWKYE